jgi:CBS domain-containing protein
MIVRDVMTTDVVTVLPGQSLKDVARLLVERRISGVPVEDGTGSVLGVVSEGDLLLRESGNHARRGGPLSWFFDPLFVVDRLKLGARVAGEVMTSPAVTIGPDRPVAAAAELMIDEAVNRLPVVQAGKLVGIVTRADLVRAFARSDAEIAREIREDIVKRTMWLEAGSVRVEVDDGDVQLTGQVDRRDDAELLSLLVGRTPGVLDVDSQLTWQDDGSR